MAIPDVAQTLGTYTFDGVNGDTNVPVAMNLTFTPFSRVNIDAVSVSDLFRSDDWTTAGSQDTAEYVEFTVTPDPAYALSPASLTFDVQRSVDKQRPSEKDGPLQGQVRIFQGLSLTLVQSQDFTLDGTLQNVVVNFLTFTTLAGETVTIRFYGWDAGHQNGWLDFDNVALSGTLSGTRTLVPEPSPAVLMGLGLMLFLGRSVLRLG